MTERIIDTGPLVALLVGDDHSHAWAVEQSKEAPPVVLTCEAVISEALFLLKRDGHESDDLFGLVEVGFLRVRFDFHEEYVRVRELMRRYRDRPMSYADACLVRMAELHQGASVWTLDGDFQFYRMHRKQALTLRVPR
ncbi:MAG TPA: PIN domain-containing protein [Rhizomicrobium sp.]